MWPKARYDVLMSPGLSSTRPLADRGVRRNGGYKSTTAPTIPFSAISVFAYSEQWLGICSKAPTWIYGVTPEMETPPNPVGAAEGCDLVILL
jgi:hypothetical protein